MVLLARSSAVCLRQRYGATARRADIHTGTIPKKTKKKNARLLS